MAWSSTQDIGARTYVCGHCDHRVASRTGWHNPDFGTSQIYLCPHCAKPSYFADGRQLPGIRAGAAVGSLPPDILAIYDEARSSAASSCYTGSVLVSRKLLMHIAVAQGAEANLRFIEYVDYLAAKGFVPPNGRSWVDHIRLKGNEATHEIVRMTEADATDLLTFLEMLLKFIYDFPSRVPSGTH